jgi:hypothetical protein
VTITGTNFAGATAVKFATKAAVSFAVESSSSITAVAPAGTGTVNVTVTTPAGVSPLRAPDRFTYLPAPVVSKILPNVGAARGGTIVTITGTGFTGASSVSFGAEAASSFAVNSGTSITAVAPPGSPGLVDVRVTTPIATSALSTRDRFKYIPSVDGIAPNAGSVAGGAVVTITGSGFSTTAGATTIKFGTKHATLVQCISSTTCTAVAPAHEAGTVDVIATVNAEASATSPPGDSFTYG